MDGEKWNYCHYKIIQPIGLFSHRSRKGPHLWVSALHSYKVTDGRKIP